MAPRPALLAALLLALAACDDPGPRTCVSACDGTPPDAQHCGLRWSLDANCQGLVEFAEIAVDQCLEPEVLNPNELLESCARVPVGTEFIWTVRSEGWLWGPWKEACVAGGGFTLEYHLGCQ
jgi:hypothetical protein